MGQKIELVRDRRGWGGDYALKITSYDDIVFDNILITLFPKKSKVVSFKVLGNYYVMGGELHNYRTSGNSDYSLITWNKDAVLRLIVSIVYDTPNGKQTWTYIGKPVPEEDGTSVLYDSFLQHMSEANFLGSGYQATIFMSVVVPVGTPIHDTMMILERGFDGKVSESDLKSYTLNGFKVLGLGISHYYRSNMSQRYPLIKIPGEPPFIEKEPTFIDKVTGNVKNPW